LIGPVVVETQSWVTMAIPRDVPSNLFTKSDTLSANASAVLSEQVQNDVVCTNDMPMPPVRI